MAPVYIWNLTDAEPKVHINLGFPTFGPKPTIIESLTELPPDGAAILYVVAHAIPNGFSIGGKTLDESEVARQLRERRGSAPTLIVLDTCFAESFLVVPGASWPAEFVFVFASMAYERTWHTGSATKPPRVSIFSSQFDAAIGSTKSPFTWDELQTELRKRLGLVQTPVIAPRNVSPQVFFT